MQIYEVRAGDTLYSLARRNGTTVETLARLNQLNDPARLVIGQSLVIPDGREGPREEIEVNAYVYPNVTQATLEETLPYLTTLCPFSYSATMEGNLRPIPDERLIESAYREGVAPLLTVTNLSENAGFSSAIGHAVLTDEAVQNRVLDEIVDLIREKDYYGLNINFEYLYPFDRDAYSNFVRRAADRLHPLGCPVSTAIAPKESAGQSGLLYTAHDYEAHGRYADRVILMTYEWGYLYGAPQAVSPVNRIRRVLDYAVTAIPPGKILMGFSNYAYDWTLPWKQGDAARLLSNAGAINLAISRGAPIRYDTVAQAPWFNYVDAAGRTHVVWFEDARSARARLRLVEEYGLAGISIWTADQLNRPMLAVLESMYSVEKIL
ncbi:MAG: LysM peptidoglycan-binding domain-containing protein [Oscillospiraceae bacterium]|nr:LysM peptidoglycan-binding domain-containing protein [Oscillospiraceae bacterium]